jgi:hypothetical protein
MKQARRPRGRGSTTVRLQDLDPRGEVRGGTGKRVFGEHLSENDPAATIAERPTSVRRSRQATTKSVKQQ